MGIGFVNDKSGQQLILFLSNFLLRENVVNPLNDGTRLLIDGTRLLNDGTRLLNDGTRLYFSLLYDGSSSAKTLMKKNCT